MDADEQVLLDERMIELDGTRIKTLRCERNSRVSLAIAKAPPIMQVFRSIAMSVGRLLDYYLFQ